MSVDWKSRLIEAAGTRSPAGLAAQSTRGAVQRVVDHAVQSGVALTDVRQFAAQEPALKEVAALCADVFADDSARKAASAVVGSAVVGSAVVGSERRAQADSGATSPGRRALSVRANPALSLPWFKQAALPPMPPSTLTQAGTNSQAVVIDGVTFSAADVASLLKLAA
jgi:hypothetical protein